MPGTVYKIGVNIPESHLTRMMDAVAEVARPIYPGYDRVFCWWPVKGTWRPLEGSDPYRGKVGEVEVSDEMRVEFAVLEDDLGKAVDAVRRAHPYEEPAIDVIPMIPWKSVLTGSDGR